MTRRKIMIYLYEQQRYFGGDSDNAVGAYQFGGVAIGTWRIGNVNVEPR